MSEANLTAEANASKKNYCGATIESKEYELTLLFNKFHMNRATGI